MWGSEVYGFVVRRGWAQKDEAFEICVGGACDLSRTPARVPVPSVGS